MHSETGRVRRFLMIAAFVASTLGLQSLPGLRAEEIPDNYIQWTQEATAAFNKGNYSQAISLMERALTIAPEVSLPSLYNNLAAMYMKRGNYYHDREKNDAASLNDFRQGVFWLDYAWPEGVERKALHQENLKIARQNLLIGYNNLKINPSDPALHLKLAKELRLQGRFKESVVEYARAVALTKAPTGQAEALKALGDLFTVLNRPEKSKKYYSQALTALGNKAPDDLLARLANAQNKSGEPDAAVKTLNQALEKNPANASALNQLEAVWKSELKFNPASVTAHANLAGIYQKKKQYVEALNQYQAAEHFAVQDPNTPFDVKKLIRLNIGTLFQETRQFDKAAQAYDTILQADSQNQLALYYKATLYRDMGQTEQAIQYYYRLLGINPNYENAHQDLLALFAKQPDVQKRFLALKTYADRFPQNALIQSKVGEELHHAQDFQGAVTYYERALALKPNTAGVYANLGTAYQALGKTEASLAALKRAAELDPDNETLRELASHAAEAEGTQTYQQAVEAFQAGRVEESLPLFEKALTSNPNNADMQAAYGVALQNAKKLPEAIQAYQKALALDANNATHHYYLATAYHQNQQVRQALQAYKKALALDPNQAEARQALQALQQGQVATTLEQALQAYQNKQYSQALSLVQKALTEDPGNATAYYYKGLIQEGLKQKAGAIQSYRQAVQKNPDFSDAYYALGVALEGRDAAGAKTAYRRFIELSQGEENDFVKYARQRLQGP